MQFDFGPIADALAVRGRVVVRRAYADWSYFDEDRRALTRHQVELIEMTQRMGASRKNAADIKMVVDAIEMAFEREYISTFVMCTGDSDFSPLVHKLRELNKRVIGVGVEKSTSRLLPAACDEFLFYDRLEGVDVPDSNEPASRASRAGRGNQGDRGRKRSVRAAEAVEALAGAAAHAQGAEAPEPAEATTSAKGRGRRKATTPGDDAAPASGSTSGSTTGSTAESTAAPAAEPAVEPAAEPASAAGGTRRRTKAAKPEPAAPEADAPHATDAAPAAPERSTAEDESNDDTAEAPSMEVQVAQTLANLAASTSGAVTASMLKRTLLRKDPTFSEADYGFRTFGDFVRFLADRGFLELGAGPTAGDPEVSLPEQGGSDQTFALVRAVVEEAGTPVPLSGLKNRLRKRRPDFSEKALGFRGFLQFCRAAEGAGAVVLTWDDGADDYLVTVA
ncbi:NYN domain-containing protein [Xylanimonas allomyrinae]|uniref:NYN domain-containing protein n=1 Tax=Xylanimonas allomyrinae TaxID=2509459 RepID=UPI001FEA5B35|nr:NYN domain-containing protein [Xylanimonas allomyrinae]